MPDQGHWSTRNHCTHGGEDQLHKWGAKPQLPALVLWNRTTGPFSERRSGVPIGGWATSTRGGAKPQLPACARDWILAEGWEPDTLSTGLSLRFLKEDWEYPLEVGWERLHFSFMSYNPVTCISSQILMSGECEWDSVKPHLWAESIPTCNQKVDVNNMLWEKKGYEVKNCKWNIETPWYWITEIIASH